jgi:hypothetical protein
MPSHNPLEEGKNTTAITMEEPHTIKEIQFAQLALELAKQFPNYVMVGPSYSEANETIPLAPGTTLEARILHNTDVPLVVIGRAQDFSANQIHVNAKSTATDVILDLDANQERKYPLQVLPGLKRRMSRLFSSVDNYRFTAEIGIEDHSVVSGGYISQFTHDGRFIGLNMEGDADYAELKLCVVFAGIIATGSVSPFRNIHGFAVEKKIQQKKDIPPGDIVFLDRKHGKPPEYIPLSEGENSATDTQFNQLSTLADDFIKSAETHGENVWTTKEEYLVTTSEIDALPLVTSHMKTWGTETHFAPVAFKNMLACWPDNWYQQPEKKMPDLLAADFLADLQKNPDFFDASLFIGSDPKESDIMVIVNRKQLKYISEQFSLLFINFEGKTFITGRYSNTTLYGHTTVSGRVTENMIRDAITSFQAALNS